MILRKAAIAGTLESSDTYISVQPGNGKIELQVESSVMNQYGRQIRTTVKEVLQQFEVSDALVTVIDKGALDCTLRARLQCALFRSSEIEQYPWGVL